MLSRFDKTKIHKLIKEGVFKGHHKEGMVHTFGVTKDENGTRVAPFADVWKVVKVWTGQKLSKGCKF